MRVWWCGTWWVLDALCWGSVAVAGCIPGVVGLAALVVWSVRLYVLPALCPGPAGLLLSVWLLVARPGGML